MASVRHRANAPGRVVFGVTDPGHAVATHLNNDLANAFQKIGFVSSVNQCLTTADEHLQLPIGSPEMLLGAQTFADVHRHADDLDTVVAIANRVEIGVKDHLTDPRANA